MILTKDIPDEGFLAYDLESTSIYAPYAELKMVSYQLGLRSEPILVDPSSRKSKDRFRQLLKDPDIIKVGYNNVNYDDIVLFRHGFYVNPINRHDLYLALKTIHPTYPSYSLKFVNWALNMPEQSLDDAWHEAEGKLDAWLLKHQKEKGSMYSAPQELLEAYCRHDVVETVNVFRAVWEIVQQPKHWRPYTELELAMANPLHEMILMGREFVDIAHIKERIRELEEEKEAWNEKAIRLSGGKITNAASSKQIGEYLKTIDNIEIDISDKDNFVVRKADLLEFLDLEDRENDRNKIARCCYEVRDIAKVIGYLKSYLRAGLYERKDRNNSQNGNVFPVMDYASLLYSDREDDLIDIPKSYYLSGARTRRFQSSSRFGINWQNQNDRSKTVQIVPRGWLGWWIDSTQIENVVHIWASNDRVRRKAYEADPDWSEYVWLCNTILGGNRNRKELEAIDSPVNPSWSIYKQFKTIKLALNFGLGVAKFADNTGLSTYEAQEMFDQVHRACPAIRKLQVMVRNHIKEHGFIMDPFGHIYSGNIDATYKIVAYLIQGCGTGSIPKAMTVANYESIHRLDTSKPIYKYSITHPFTGRVSYGTLCGTTHDECAGRISLGLPTNRIVSLIKELLYNMEEKFSSLFDGIPLRAKLAVSITNASEQRKLDHRSEGFEKELTAIIRSGKEKIRTAL